MYHPSKDIAVFTFGRFNPPTIGHQKLLMKVRDLAEEEDGDFYVFGSFSKDKKRNPLGHYNKMKYLVQMFPNEMDGYIEPNKEVRTALDACIYLNNYKNITMVVGDDRVESFTKLINNYNGKELKNGKYYFDTINIVSAGTRDPDSDGVEGMSASKMREAAANNNYEEFKKGLPRGYEGKSMFNDVRKNMGY